MAGSRRRNLAIVALCAGLLAGYLAVWVRLDPVDQGRSDFANAYVGGQLLRDGRGPRLYDETLQGAYHARALAPDREGNLPFVAAPTAAVLAVPFTVFDLRTAWRIFSLVQLVLLVAAALVAARAAPWPRGAPDATTVAVVTAALACIGTETVLVQGQWGGVFALGVALGYRELRRGRLGRATLALSLPIWAVKPNLGLGLAAFCLGLGWWRAWRAMAASAAVILGASLVIGRGTSAITGFVAAAARVPDRWRPHEMDGMAGLVAAIAGDGRAASAAGIVLCLAAGLAAYPLGRAVARRPQLLEPGLAAAAVLTLLASPHVFTHDFGPLVPAAVWLAAWALRPDTVGPDARRVVGTIASRRLPILAGLWGALIVAGLIEVAFSGGLPSWGRFAPWLLCLLAAAAAAPCAARSSPAALETRRLSRV